MKYPPALNPLRNTQFSWLLPLTWALLQCAAVTAPVTVEVFLHHRFGARTGKNLIKGFLLLLLVAPIVRAASPPPGLPLFNVFILAYAGFALWHWFDSHFGVRTEHAHSLLNGEPRPGLWNLLPVSESTFLRFVEPACCYFIGRAMKYFDPALGNWILVAGCALCIQAQWRYYNIRTHQLDSLDGRIESTRRTPRSRTENDEFVEARPAPPHRRWDNR